MECEYPFVQIFTIIAAGINFKAKEDYV